jgi:hypothetical protein
LRFFSTGFTEVDFQDDGKTPVAIERLKRVVMKGDKRSAQILRSLVGRQSHEEDLLGRACMARRTSSFEKGRNPPSCEETCPCVNTGAGALAIEALTVETLLEK